MAKKKRKSPEVEISIGKLARAAGISTATIHFYRTAGLLPPARKLSRTRAAYTQRHLRILHIVRRMKNVGYSLEQVKRALQQYGSDDAGLDKIEGIGALQPLPPPRTDPDQSPIELFDPVDRATFLARAECSPELLDALLARGDLRPRQDGRFDARDLWMVRMVAAMHRDGVTMEELSLLGVLRDAARRALPILERRAACHIAELRSRQLRFTDLVEPFRAALLYYVDRLATEADVDWRGKVFLELAKD